MKNAMKKLLSLVLVAMLLVSVVPLGAAATEVAMPYIITLDGTTTLKSGTYSTDDTKSLQVVLEEIYPGYSASYYVGYYVDGVVKQGTDAVPNSGTVTFALTTPPAEQVAVKIVLSGVGERSFNVDKGSSLTLNQALLNEHGLTLSYNHTIVQWNDNYNPTNPIADGTTVTVNDATTFTCTQRNNNVIPNGSNNNNTNNNNNTTTENAEKVTLNVYLNDSTTASYTNTDTIAKETTTVKNLLTYWYGSTDGFVQAHTKRTGTVTDINTSINRGETVSVRLSTSNNTSTKPTTPVTETYTVYFYKGTSQLLQTSVAKGGKVSYDNAVTAANLAGTTNFAGWKVENAGNTLTNEAVANYAINSNGIRFYAQYTTTNGSLNTKGRQVLLNIYINGKLTAPAKTVDITNYTIVSDGTLNLDEVETVVDDYYKAGNSNKGFQLDGLYVTAGNSIVNYATDSNKQSSWNINSVFEKFNSSTIAFNVYAPNVTAKTSSTADSSNPKTGDTIFAPVAVLTLSTAALAAVYFISKKRVVR